MAYKTVNENFWRDGEIKQLSPEEKLFYLYVITGPHSHFSGIYFLPKPYIIHDLGFSLKQIGKCIDTLSIGYQYGIDGVSEGKFFLRYDNEREIIWIRNMLRYQAFVNNKVSPKIVASVRNQLLSLPLSPLLHEFSRYYPELSLPFFAPESIPYHTVSVSEAVSVEETVTEEVSVSNPHSAADKQRHMDYVLLSPEEHQKLLETLNGKSEEYITRLNNYIGQIGLKAAAKKYKSHYHTILNWYSKDKDKDPSKGSWRDA